MTQIDPELRQLFRADLIDSVGKALTNDLPKALQHAMIEMVDRRVFDSIDKMLDRFLSQDDMDCWLSFGKDGPVVLVGMGPGECAAQFKPILYIESYFKENISGDEEQEILDQIAAIRAFVARLTETQKVLEARAKVFSGRVVQMTPV